MFFFQRLKNSTSEISPASNTTHSCVLKGKVLSFVLPNQMVSIALDIDWTDSNKFTYKLTYVLLIKKNAKKYCSTMWRKNDRITSIVGATQVMARTFIYDIFHDFEAEMAHLWIGLTSINWFLAQIIAMTGVATKIYWCTLLIIIRICPACDISLLTVKFW